MIAGANGSGKTTLLRHLNGLLLPESGDVRVDGVRVAEKPGTGAAARSAWSSRMPTARSSAKRSPTMWPSGPETSGWRRADIQRRVDGALAAVGPSDLADQAPFLLSGGEKRRLAIAGVLAMEPMVVAFDEPFSNLDYPGVRQVLAQMAAIHKSGRTVLVTTHDLEKVVAFADRLVLIEKGRIVKDGFPRRGDQGGRSLRGAGTVRLADGHGGGVVAELTLFGYRSGSSRAAPHRCSLQASLCRS